MPPGTQTHAHARALLADMEQERVRLDELIPQARADVEEQRRRLATADADLRRLLASAERCTTMIPFLRELAGAEETEPRTADSETEGPMVALEPAEAKPATPVRRKRARLGPERAAVQEILRRSGGEMSQKALWEALEGQDLERPKNYKAFQVMCGRMVSDGQLVRTDTGVFDLVDRVAAQQRVEARPLTPC